MFLFSNIVIKYKSSRPLVAVNLQFPEPSRFYLITSVDAVCHDLNSRVSAVVLTCVHVNSVS
jgi:hypothetical protein